MRNDTILYREKVDEMMRVYREVAPDCWTQKQAVERVIKHKASRYFVSGRTAYLVLRLMFRNGGRSMIRNKCQAAMYLELYRLVVQLSQDPDNRGMTLYELCEKAVHKEASSFFITEDTFRKIRRSEQKRLMELHKKR